jgi:peroxin-5
MAMRGLVEAECGGANPLVELASHLTQDKSLRQEGLPSVLDRTADLGQAAGDTLAGQFVHEFLQETGQYDAPQTFGMQSLLEEMHHLQDEQPAERSEGTTIADQWADEFLAKEEDHEWVDEYVGDESEQWASEFVDKEEQQQHMWAEEFVRQREDLQATARDLVESTINNPQLSGTKFMDFVRGLGDGSIDLDAADNEELLESVTDRLSKIWANEFEEERAAATAQVDNRVEQDVDVFDKLHNEWEKLAEEDKQGHPWLDEYDSLWKKDYQFVKENPLKDHVNAFDEGLKRLKEGDLANAILLFEAAVLSDPDHVDAWQYLGVTQAQNEQDVAAIAALQKCISLCPGNLVALQALAVSFTNESMQSQACDALMSWLRENPQYKDMAPQEEKARSPRPASLMTTAEHKRLENLYLSAAQRNPSTLDPEVQVGLGVLYNLSGDYDKAIDCFQAALQLKPDDPLLWNKLGATLANGNRSEEAVHAYHQALKLSPGFVRARYNLGISCVNLGAHHQAAEQFVTALGMQQQGLGPSDKHSQMSNSIWSTLRMSLVMLSRPDLVSQCDARQLEALKRELDI